MCDEYFSLKKEKLAASDLHVWRLSPAMSALWESSPWPLGTHSTSPGLASHPDGFWRCRLASRLRGSAWKRGLRERLSLPVLRGWVSAGSSLGALVVAFMSWLVWHLGAVELRLGGGAMKSGFEGVLSLEVIIFSSFLLGDGGFSHGEVFRMTDLPVLLSPLSPPREFGQSILIVVIPSLVSLPIC